MLHTRKVSKPPLSTPKMNNLIVIVYDAVFEQMQTQLRADVLKVLVQSNASPSQKRQLLSEKGLSRHVLDELDILLEGGQSISVQYLVP